ncbi:MAG: hypothetical protein C0404_06210, partial [Verrucomicrobia bacterium]|nr:hypothetical protein [Verrucomicrobiota bacterium]
MPLKFLRKIGSKLFGRKSEGKAQGKTGTKSEPAHSGRSSAQPQPPAASAAAPHADRPHHARSGQGTGSSSSHGRPQGKSGDSSRSTGGSSSSRGGRPHGRPQGGGRPGERPRGRRPERPESQNFQQDWGPSRNDRRPEVKEHKAPLDHNWLSESFKVPPEEGKIRFQDLDLPVEVMHAVSDLGFKYCTPVQGQVLPHTLAGKNIAGRSQTGTGKTAAFLISILTRLSKDQVGNGPNRRGPRA